jgi:hypothetical protein
MGTVRLRGNGGGRVTVAEAGQLLIERLETKGRRRTTLETYESHIRVHLVPFFGKQRLDRIGRREIEAFIRHMGRTGRSTLNATGVLHSIFELARREGWGRREPVHAGRQASGAADGRRHPLPRARGDRSAAARRTRD